MKYIKWLSWLPLVLISILTQALCYPLAPIAVLFANNGDLPNGFKWMETPDNPLLGDKSHKQRWKNIRYEYSWLDSDYFQMVAWLWRNKANSFRYYQLGRVPEGKFEFEGNPSTQSDNVDGHYGYRLTTCDNMWSLFGAFRLPDVKGYRVLFRTYLGWKMRSFNDNSTQRTMLAFNVSFRIRKI